MFTLSPFTNLRDIQRNIDSLTSAFLTPGALSTPTLTCEPCEVCPAGAGGGGETDVINFLPSVDVKDKDDAIILHFDLPGVRKEDIKLSVEDNKLIVKGEKKLKKKDEGENWIRKERAHGKFYRIVTLPPGVDARQVQANYENGVLEIVVPKNLELGKKQTIQIGAKGQEGQEGLLEGEREQPTGERVDTSQQKGGEKDTTQQTSGEKLKEQQQKQGSFESTGGKREGLDTRSQSAQV